MQKKKTLDGTVNDGKWPSMPLLGPLMGCISVGASSSPGPSHANQPQVSLSWPKRPNSLLKTLFNLATWIVVLGVGE